MKKKYTVTIEQPMLISLTVEAEDIDEAQEIAREKYDNMERTAFDKEAEFGTDAQCQIDSEDGEESSDWNDL